MKNILTVENLYLDLIINGTNVSVLQDISFAIYEREILALVGESGCGKSLTALSITKLLPKLITKFKSGKIIYDNKDIVEMDIYSLRDIRGKEISYIFQDPFTSLNPLMKVKDQMIEAYKLHISPNEKEAIEKAKYLLNKVGITDLKERLGSYPGQLSGGMLQRVAIAMALMCDPVLLIADEPTSALDVTVQTQLIDLLLRLREEIKMSILFISHDLALVAALADRIAIMYAGQIVETEVSGEIITNAKHPYTQALLGSVPNFELSIADKKLKSIPGMVPSPKDYPIGCHFHDRCEFAFESCKKIKPELYNISNSHSVRCLLEKDNRL
jgi:peptide/nickel transport system ATP-binding protein